MIMKKVFNSFFVIIAAMVTFAGCAKQEIDAPATPETKTVQFFANSIETKTAFGTPDGTTYPTLWSTGDKVKVLLNLESVKNTEKSVEVECSDDFKSARFAVELAQPEADTYTYYSISPSTALLGKTTDKLYVEIPKEQTPLPTSVDMKGQLLYAASETTSTISESVELNYQHLTAYGKFSLLNLAHESVLSIKIEAPNDVNLAGKWDYFVADGSFEVRSGNGYNSITLNTTSATDIWFACAPVDMSEKKMILTVTTEQGDLVKEISFPENRKFEAGRIAKFTVDMAGIEVEGTDAPENPGETTSYYEKVTSATADWSGKYLIVFGTSAHATNTNNKDLTATTSVKITDNKIAVTEALSDAVMTVTKSGDKYHMKYPDGNYFGMARNASTSVKNAFDLTFTYTNSGVKISGVVSGTTYILYSNNGNYFRCYTDKTGTTGYTLPTLYKLVGEESEGGEGGETPVDPVQLTMSEITCSEQTENSLTFIWPAVTNASKYEVTFNNGTPEEVDTESYTATGLTASTEYTISVKAVGDGTNYETSEAKTQTGKTKAAQGGGDEPSSSVTVSKTIEAIADANGWTNSTQYSTITLDEVITATATVGTNTGKYYTSGEEWRIYQSETPNLTITASAGYTIKTVKITYNIKNDGVLTYNSSNVTSGTAVTVNATSISFGVGNTSTATNGQVKVTAIEVVYQSN